jgi:hypothetical protein
MAFTKTKNAHLGFTHGKQDTMAQKTTKLG